MSEETRTQMTKLCRQKAEDATISLRNARHEAINDAKALEKDKSISQDQLSALEKSATSLIDSYQKQVHEMVSQKETELMQT
jgi:ribosome recycling factor